MGPFPGNVLTSSAPLHTCCDANFVHCMPNITNSVRFTGQTPGPISQLL